MATQHETCPQCTSADLLSVTLSPRGGTPMRFNTCRHCENRWWEDITVGVVIDLTDVLDHIAG
ncbi:MAG: hypothetical protein ACR2HR_12585 [Euzebya sp.]